MSEHIQRAIDEFEATIARLTATVESLRWFQREFPHTAAAVSAIDEATHRRKYTRRTVGAKGKKRHIKRTNERTNERSKARATRERSAEPP